MDLSVFFQAITLPEALASIQAEPRLGQQLQIHQRTFPDWRSADLVLLSASLQDHQQLPQTFRRHLYSLSLPHPRLRMADLGHLKPQENLEDTLEQLSYLLAYLHQEQKTCLLLIDDQSLALAQAQAFEGSESPIELVHIDAQPDLLDSSLLLDQQSFAHALLQPRPQWLFDYTLLGYQRYFVGEEQLDWLSERHYAALRYGQLAAGIEQAEPYLRTAQVVTADLSAVRASDSPGSRVLSPGGFSAEEFCRLARYAGLGYHQLSFSLCGWDPALDRREQSSRLAALAAWYFIDGCTHRYDDFPREDRANLTRYSVRLHASIEKIEFYRHRHSDRWWMEVPHPDHIGEQYPPHRLVACSEADYETAKQDDIPERWWQTFQKLSG